MAQHDYVIANGTGAAVRSDINNALAAIVSQNSGPVAPTTTYAYMPWADTGSSPPVFKIRNAANNGWITLYELDGTFSVEAGSASSPGLYFTGDINTGIYSPGADQFGISTGGTSRLVIDSSGNVNVDSGTVYVDAANNRLGIGTTAADQTLHVQGSARFSGTTTAGSFLDITSSNTGSDGVNLSVSYYGSGSYGPLKFAIGGSERGRFDTSGRFLVGTSTTEGFGAKLQIRDDGGLNCELFRSNATASGPTFALNKSRGSAGSPTAVGSGDILAYLAGKGYDGSNYIEAATIKVEVDGAVNTANDMPGRIVFSTTADGASSPTERVRIDNLGRVYFKKTVNDYTTEGAIINQGAGPSSDTSFVTAGGTAATFARSINDGTILSFRQDGTEEGTISVSGTTVSYNGAHLSRWSQLPGGIERTEILRGTVLSNIDEMCAWGEEDNEQLNRMKVSDVESDPNVAGVFQAWDDDDDTYTDDFYCAMTGDFIIRIAEGVTVQRGDLLMSAGDGTAKPQDDDIIRSKTIAKVTSTHVTCTYDDGSYCVPCVLMAC
jgi:hypothetical protein